MTDSEPTAPDFAEGERRTIGLDGGGSIRATCLEAGRAEWGRYRKFAIYGLPTETLVQINGEPADDARMLIEIATAALGEEAPGPGEEE